MMGDAPAWHPGRVLQAPRFANARTEQASVMDAIFGYKTVFGMQENV